MTKLSPAELLQSLAAVRALNVHAGTRELVHDVEEGELVPEGDVDVTVSFWSSSEPDSADATTVVEAAACGAASHFCEEHGLEVLTRLDFHELSSLFKRQVLLTPQTGTDTS
jgi:hypothetical protein